MGALRPRAEQERLAVRLDHVVRAGAVEAAAQEGERLVGDRAAPAAIDAERAELGLHPAHADAESQAPARELLQGRDRFAVGSAGR